MTQNNPILGIILAGGQARRMGGGDKCLLPLGGRTLLQRSIDKAAPQVDHLLLSANGNQLRFARSRLTVLPDEYPDFPGPLAGIHAGLSWLNRHRPDSEWLVSFAADTPFFPSDLVEKLSEAAQSAQTRVAVACSEGRMHPIFALWHHSLLDSVSEALRSEHSPRLQDWVRAQNGAVVSFYNPGFDPFFNINHPQDLYNAEAFLPLTDE